MIKGLGNYCVTGNSLSERHSIWVIKASSNYTATLLLFFFLFLYHTNHATCALCDKCSLTAQMILYTSWIAFAFHGWPSTNVKMKLKQATFTLNHTMYFTNKFDSHLYERFYDRSMLNSTTWTCILQILLSATHNKCLLSLAVIGVRMFLNSNPTLIVHTRISWMCCHQRNMVTFQISPGVMPRIPISR